MTHTPPQHVLTIDAAAPMTPRPPGGERVLEVFDIKLKEAIYKLPFDKILTLKNVRNTINEADGYQPHIIAPEAGYRRLIEDGLTLLREPCASARSTLLPHTACSAHAALRATVGRCTPSAQCIDAPA
jgi:hypothetical protein